jgi:hypothetical protein
MDLLRLVWLSMEQNTWLSRISAVVTRFEMAVNPVKGKCTCCRMREVENNSYMCW